MSLHATDPTGPRSDDPAQDAPRARARPAAAASTLVAPFAWTVGRPVPAGDGAAPAWLAFLAPGVASADDWIDFLRR